MRFGAYNAEQIGSSRYIGFNLKFVCWKIEIQSLNRFVFFQIVSIKNRFVVETVEESDRDTFSILNEK